MNFKICEGALARILETLAIYDFDVEFRQGSRHTNADSISCRPCLDQTCAHCERFEKRYTSSKIKPGLATKNIGVMSVEGVKRGESQETDETQRSSEQKLKGSSPSEDSLRKLSMCFEEGPLQSHCSSKECLSTGGIKQNTPPTPGSPKEERIKSLRKKEALQPQRMTENCQESLG